MLIISWKMGAAQMCVFTKEEWTRGMTEIGYLLFFLFYRCDIYTSERVSSVAELKKKIPSLYSEINNSAEFAQFYEFVFTFSKKPDQRSLELDIAVNVSFFWQFNAHLCF